MWPENWPTLLIFGQMFLTQWHESMNGPEGLRYEAVPLLMEAASIPRSDLPQVMEGLRVMEVEALRYWRDKTNRR